MILFLYIVTNLLALLGCAYSQRDTVALLTPGASIRTTSAKFVSTGTEDVKSLPSLAVANYPASNRRFTSLSGASSGWVRSTGARPPYPYHPDFSSSNPGSVRFPVSGPSLSASTQAGSIRGNSASLTPLKSAHIYGPTATAGSVEKNLPPPPEETLIVATMNDQIISETFRPTTRYEHISLQSTVTSISYDAQSSPHSVIARPGEVAWAPFNQQTTAPAIPPPTFFAAKPTTTSSEGVLPLITSSYNPRASKISSVDPSITVDTTTHTSDDEHPKKNYPFIKGGKHCWFCPPGIDGGGLVLWGMDRPGIYPPPPTPPFPGVKNFPTITIGKDLVPTEADNDDKEPTSSAQDSPTSTAESISRSTESSSQGSSTSTASCTTSVIVSNCNVICSASNSAATCSTSCSSTATGCSMFGTTVTSTAGASACGPIAPFSPVVTEDESDYGLTPTPDRFSSTGISKTGAEITSPTYISRPVIQTGSGNLLADSQSRTRSAFTAGTLNPILGGSAGFVPPLTTWSGTGGGGTASLGKSYITYASSGISGVNTGSALIASSSYADTVSENTVYAGVPVTSASTDTKSDAIIQSSLKQVTDITKSDNTLNPPTASLASISSQGLSTSVFTNSVLSTQVSPVLSSTLRSIGSALPSNSVLSTSPSAQPSPSPESSSAPPIWFPLSLSKSSPPPISSVPPSVSPVVPPLSSFSTQQSTASDDHETKASVSAPLPSQSTDKEPPKPAPPINAPAPHPVEPVATTLPTKVSKLGKADAKTVCSGPERDGASDIFTCLGNATLFQMFAPQGTEHSHGKPNDQSPWRTWKGGGCRCYGSDFCCAENVKLPIVGDPIEFYKGLSGQCNCWGHDPEIPGSDDIAAEKSSFDLQSRSVDYDRNQVHSDVASRLYAIVNKQRRRDGIAESENPEETHTLMPGLHPRVDRSATWKKSAKKGLDLWKEFNNKDKNLPNAQVCDARQEWAFRDPTKWTSPAGVGFKKLLAQLNVGSGVDYFSTSLYWPKEAKEKIADLHNAFSPKDGVIVASSNTRGNDLTKEYAPNYWNEVVWYLWLRACISANVKNNHPNLYETKNLRYVFRKNIKNGQTLEVLSVAVEGRTMGQPIYLTPTDQDTDRNPFWALLGSPNGNGIIRLLIDNKNTLEGRRITRMGVWQYADDQSEIHMWAEISL